MNKGPNRRVERDKKDRFHNPYTFVPTPARGGIPPSCYAGDHNPVPEEAEENHSRLWPGRWHGNINMKMTVVTPVFIPKSQPRAEGDEKNEHKRLHCSDHVPPTSIKGMLRSAFETVTNSRFGVFGKQNSKPVGYRKPIDNTLVPAVLVRQENMIELFPGTAEIGKKKDNLQYAAWVPAYRVNKGKKTWEPIGGLPESGSFVDVELEKWENTRRNFTFWRVTKIDEKDLPAQSGGDNYKRIEGKRVKTKGYLVATGRIAENKHDERLFFDEKFGGAGLKVPVPQEVIERYDKLLANYREIHEDEDRDPGGFVQLGPHITSKNRKSIEFVYAKVKVNEHPPEKYKVEAVYPVQISRDLDPATPADCLDASLKPAESIEHLSPADRLFGWVNDAGEGAWKGKVRFVPGGVGKPLQFDSDVPLSILSSPKPSQTRFYLGDAKGNPLPARLKRDCEAARYSKGRHIRGRKTWWHHPLLAGRVDYWEAPWENRTDTENPEGYFQEYRQPAGDQEKTGQNCSITGWFSPGTEIFFSLRCENLTDEEAGGLLYLAKLNAEGQKKHHFRLGHGKPLGLGSVLIELDGPPSLERTEDILESYKNPFEATEPVHLSGEKVTELVETFKEAMASSYGFSSFEALPFVKNFLAAASGPRTGHPVIYPRTSRQRLKPHQQGGGEPVPSFEWFVKNDKTEKRNPPPGFVLPKPEEDDGLPYEPSQAADQGNEREGGRRHGR
jgi:CRISPR-associated protein (TIGR03986 family)